MSTTPTIPDDAWQRVRRCARCGVLQPARVYRNAKRPSGICWTCRQIEAGRSTTPKREAGAIIADADRFRQVVAAELDRLLPLADHGHYNRRGQPRRPFASRTEASAFQERRGAVGVFACTSCAGWHVLDVSRVSRSRSLIRGGGAL